MDADLSRLHVVLPVRSLSGGKARLRGSLDPEEREALNTGLLRHVLAVLADWSVQDRIHVVTLDPNAAALAQTAGAEAILQQGEGLNEALREARRHLLRARASAMLVLPIDLPLLGRDGLHRMLDAADAALAAGSGRPLVVLAPADARTGTNALLLSPPDVIEPCFGPHSLEAHIRAAAAAGATLQLVVDPAFGFDLDTPEDLQQLDPGRLRELEELGEHALWSAPPER